MNRSLYERIGGESAVRTTVIKLYGKILDDPELAPFFEKLDVEKLRLSQSAFVTYAFGGPNHYTGKSMRAAHQNAVSQGLSDRHFDKVVVHLKSALQELQVPEPLIEEALHIVNGTRKDVLGQ
jgi:hemoglobin